ncbi:DUF6375 family protein [Luteolibacter sp. LG18]|uniref:DUF6375 family protein n=1 Tax=Luteolibacter sp. LG18 TaxID=2819286 RepID=UPI002B2928D8|nr:hypothetical protein llg_17760 [Luteolibacter sp. LG18]
MKIWKAYGSEHSMNLVMVGHFKSEKDAEKTQKIFENLASELAGKVDIGSNNQYFGSEILDIVVKLGCGILSPSELEHFLYDVDTRVEGDRIVITTDETEVAGFFKVMIDNGAKVEIYSAHHYPGEPESQDDK